MGGIKNEQFLNKILHGDCLEWMTQINDDSVDLIIVDPPYYQVKGEFDFVFESEEHYLFFMKTCLNQFTRVLKPTGSMYVYCSQQMGAYIDLMLRDVIDIKNRLIWYRSGGVSPKKKFKLSHEPLFYCVKDIDNHTWNVDEIRVLSKYADKDKRLNPNGKVPDDVWEIPNLVGKKKEKVNHPTQKPLQICERIIKASSNIGDTLLIPFVGSGSECVSAIKFNRNFIGIEKEWDYCEIANERIKEAYKQNSIKK
ncbi:DNA-methyltransferase [Litchfieldia alkalitelluris]|uniref:DNA-methyltransferase n=1 Tax=Litchfieldia alkalitelluris TaxID=304268 RepID=UPI000997D986|nr:DNA methyltransferase [Litchfieldia alkalitelluris]